MRQFIVSHIRRSEPTPPGSPRPRARRKLTGAMEAQRQVFSTVDFRPMHSLSTPSTGEDGVSTEKRPSRRSAESRSKQLALYFLEAESPSNGVSANSSVTSRCQRNLRLGSRSYSVQVVPLFQPEETGWVAVRRMVDPHLKNEMWGTQTGWRSLPCAVDYFRFLFAYTGFHAPGTRTPPLSLCGPMQAMRGEHSGSG